MVEPYQAVGLIQTMRGIRRRDEIQTSLDQSRTTTDQYQLIYEQPIYPTNSYRDRQPYDHAGYREQVTRRQVRLLQRGIWARPDDGRSP